MTVGRGHQVQESDFPALYLAAGKLSADAQQTFFRALKINLILLVLAAVLSIAGTAHWLVAALQLLTLLGALACSVYLFSIRPERNWYSGRAVAESIKTITWRFVSRAEPFQGDDASARIDFQRTLGAIVQQNRGIAQSLTTHLQAPQVTDAMLAMRARSLNERRRSYVDGRVNDQLAWYAEKAATNKRNSSVFFWALLVINAAAVVSATLRIGFLTAPFWPTDVLVAAAASLLSWMQAKRFSELSSAYALAAHEIGLIREQSEHPQAEDEFSTFVGDAENAFSREHTQWVARKDV